MAILQKRVYRTRVVDIDDLQSGQLYQIGSRRYCCVHSIKGVVVSMQCRQAGGGHLKHRFFTQKEC